MNAMERFSWAMKLMNGDSALSSLEQARVTAAKAELGEVVDRALLNATNLVRLYHNTPNREEMRKVLEALESGGDRGEA